MKPERTLVVNEPTRICCGKPRRDCNCEREEAVANADILPPAPSSTENAEQEDDGLTNPML